MWKMTILYWTVGGCLKSQTDWEWTAVLSNKILHNYCMTVSISTIFVTIFHACLQLFKIQFPKCDDNPTINVLIVLMVSSRLPGCLSCSKIDLNYRSVSLQPSHQNTFIRHREYSNINYHLSSIELINLISDNKKS